MAPFVSEKQRRYLYSQKPDVAAQYAAHTEALKRRKDKKKKKEKK